MRNIRLTIEYDGTNFAGWQVQQGLATVQGSLIDAIVKMTGEEIKLTGASRTDAGVHALGQVANFQTSSSIPADGFMKGLNSMLPDEIVIREAVEAAPDFDSRRDSRGKTYLYRVLNRTAPSALMRRYSWFVHRPLNVALMRRAAEHMVGEKDFTSFRAADCDAQHAVREVSSVRIEENDGGLIEIEVRGTAFLRHMVRIMAGTLVAAGKGAIAPDDVAAIIAARDRTKAPMTAPSRGLFLVEVRY